MTRKLKTLGLALVAVFAMNAVMASGAMATDIFTSDSANGKTNLTGEQVGKHKFTVIGQPIECNEAHFSGTQGANGVTEQVITPVYGGCEYNGAAAQVTLSSCQYKIKAATNASGHNETEVINCPTAAPILVHIIVGGQTCTLTIINQTVGEGVKFTNETSGLKKAVVVHATAKVKIHAAAGVLACKALAGTSPVYSGATTIIGTEDGGGGEQVNITADTAPDA